MLDKREHETVLKNLLKDIYKDKLLSSLLVFKGGTAAAWFYNLPRFSVDLNFNVRKEMDQAVTKLVILRFKLIAKKQGVVEECLEKRMTLLTVLRYKKGQYMIKIEISKSRVVERFDLKDFYGIGVVVLPIEMMVAEKLHALITRKKFANRDLFDLNFFFKQGLGIDDNYFKQITDMNIQAGLRMGKKVINQKAKSKTILYGLGQLIDVKQRRWVKENLVADTVFQMKLYQKLGES